MKRICIVEWNINQRSSNKQIQPFVCDELMSNHPDFVFLVEYKKQTDFENLLKSKGYIVNSSNQVSRQNEVLIAIKEDKDFFDIHKNEVAIENSLNILSISLRYENKNICLIGTRIRVGKKDSSDQYLKREKELKDLQDYIDNIHEGYDVIIIGGDFNHCQIRCEENDDFDYEGYVQRPCSYQRIKKLFKPYELKTLTPLGKNKDIFSWVGHNHGNKYYIKQDHFILNEEIEVASVVYDWSFVHEKNGFKNMISKDYKSDVIGRPDHAKLIAEIIL